MAQSEAPRPDTTSLQASDEPADSASPDQAAQAPSPPTAADDEARNAFELGLEQLRAQHWLQAETLFRRSLELVPRASAEYDLAFVLFKQGRVRESAERLQRLLATTQNDADTRYRDYAKALLSHVLSQLSMLYLQVDPPDARLTVDSEPIALSGSRRAVPLGPGTHRIDVSAPGFTSHSEQLQSTAQTDARREITLVPALSNPSAKAAALASTPPETSTFDTYGPWIAMGLGAALLAGGGITGIFAKAADRDFTHRCPTHKDCDPNLKPAQDHAVALGTATNVLVASGAAIAAGGFVWRLLVDPSPAHDSAMLSVATRF